MKSEDEIAGTCTICGAEEYERDLVEHVDTAKTCTFCEGEYKAILSEEG